jgi:hypothetical protein
MKTLFFMVWPPIVTGSKRTPAEAIVKSCGEGVVVFDKEEDRIHQAWALRLYGEPGWSDLDQRGPENNEMIWENED